MVPRWVILVLALALAGCFGGKNPTIDPGLLGPQGFSDTDVFEGLYDITGPYSRVLEPGFLEKLPPEIVTLSSEVDGEAIRLAIVRPVVEDGVKVPVILHGAIYLPPLEEGRVEHQQGTHATDFLIENFLPHGYAIAFLNVRGTGASGGCWDFFGPKERADTSQAITWLATQEWSNGAVGMVGRSFEGASQWAAAATGNPYLKTIVPISGETDYYEWTVRNGTVSGLAAPFEYFGFAAMAGSGQFTVLDPESYGPSPDRVRDPRIMTEAACPEFLQAQQAHAETTRTGERVDVPWVADRNLRPMVMENYRGSVLLVHGLQDFFAPIHLTMPFGNHLNATGVPTKLLLGQWGHDNPDDTEGTLRWDWAEVLLHWFDYWLKGDTTRDLGPSVQVADSEGRWRSENAWPPADGATRTFHLAAGEALQESPAAAGTALVVPEPKRAVYDPTTFEPMLSNAATESCTGCARFSTQPLENDLRFAGLPQVHLTVTPQGPGGYLTAYLYREAAGGTTRIGWGQIDLAFADGGDQATPVEQGVPLEVKMELEPLDAVVAAGDRVVLVLMQGGYGDTFFYYRASAPTYPVEVELGDGRSVLNVIAFDRPDEAFFDAPGVIS